MFWLDCWIPIALVAIGLWKKTERLLSATNYPCLIQDLWSTEITTISVRFSTFGKFEFQNRTFIWLVSAPESMNICKAQLFYEFYKPKCLFSSMQKDSIWSRLAGDSILQRGRGINWSQPAQLILNIWLKQWTPRNGSWEFLRLRWYFLDITAKVDRSWYAFNSFPSESNEILHVMWLEIPIKQKGTKQPI